MIEQFDFWGNRRQRKRLDVSVHFSSASIEWATDQETFDSLNEEFGFTLDVAAASGNAKCERFFTESDNGLVKDWGGEICWMNPPYGKEIGKWIAKAFMEAKKGATVVCLIPSRTDTAYWHDYCMRGEIRFIKGRLKFGGHKKPAPFPSAIVVFRGQPKKKN